MSPRVSEILHDKTFLVHFIPTVLILIVGLGATIWGYSVAHETLARDRRQIINAIANDIERSVGNRFMLYEEILRSGVGFFAGSENVTRSDWQRYVDTLEIRMRYPGIKGIGVAPIVLESELSTHVGQATSEGIEQYQVVPTSQRDVYSPILYLEPNDTHNQQMLGYDLFNDPIRRQAMEEARDSGRAFYTDKLDPINQVSSDDQANFMVFLPYYRQQLPTDTTDQRRQAIEGFVFVPLHAEDFFNYVFSQSNDIRNVGLRIYANKKDAEHLIYENDNYKNIESSPESLMYTSSLQRNGINWIIDYRISERNVLASLRERPTNILWTGFFLTILIAALVSALLTARSKAVAIVKERDVQSAKDGLLSLASHQLRTPATGVKQYIGMVLEGYAGDLSDDQRTFLSKAYESNERQLQIINDLLYVAKVEAGRIILTRRTVDLSELVSKVVNEQRSSADEKNITVKVKLPPKPLYASIDQHTMWMAVENLVSNAIKYTHKNGNVRITLRTQRDQICLIVSDTGIGISEEQQKDLFKQFSRIPNELTQETTGSGIGLFLARHLIELHGGTITVKSQDAKGSSFVIWLPGSLRVKAPKKK